MSAWKVINGDARVVLNEVIEEAAHPIIVTDPPFNIGYGYNEYRDRMPEQEYYEQLAELPSAAPSVIIHYPEQLHRLSIELGTPPARIVSWVYNSNTRRQHRDIAYYGVEPDFSRVKQPYKNPNDKRVKELIARGSKGANLYDWVNVNQVKNVSDEKADHPCQMPVELMEKVLGLLPEGITVIDPYLGSGTTGVAAIRLGIPFIGIELDGKYCDIAIERMRKAESEKENHGY